MHGSLGFQSTLKEQVTTMHLIRLNSYWFSLVRYCKKNGKHWLTTKPPQPYFISSTHPVQKKEILQVFCFLFLKKTQPKPTNNNHLSSTFLNSSHCCVFIHLLLGPESAWQTLSDSRFSHVTETLREQIRVYRPLQEQECAANTGCACSANVLCRQP